MARQIETENRHGPRYLASLEVKAEWDATNGEHVVAEGITENVGPGGTLVQFAGKIPDVRSRVRLEVLGEGGENVQVIAEVLRIERNPGHPLAALQVLGETDEWKGLIWEPAAPRVAPPPPPADGAAGAGEAEPDDDLAN